MKMTGYANYKCKFCEATMTAQEIFSLASKPLEVTYYPLLDDNKHYTKVYPNQAKNQSLNDLLYIHCPNCRNDSKWVIEEN